MLRSSAVMLAMLAFPLMMCGPSEKKETSTNTSGASQASQASQPPGGGGDALAADMLRDPLLWGPDYPAALRTIPALVKAGETQVEILPRQVIGKRKYANRGEAERSAREAAQAQAAPPAMKAQVGTPEARQRKLPPMAAIEFPDDRSVRVGTPDHQAQYVGTNVRIEQVEQKWGKPERVTEELLDDGTDRRPIGLTLYHYANDKVIVVTTNINDPHAVDRVMVDTKTVMQVIF